MFGHLKPEKFIGLIGGEGLSAREEKHLSDCAECRSKRVAVESIYRSVSSVDRDIPEPDWNEFRASVRNELLSRSVQRQAGFQWTVWPLRPSLTWALSVLMAIGVTAAVFTIRSNPPTLPDPVPTTVQLALPSGVAAFIQTEGFEAEFTVWSNTNVFEEIAGLESTEAAHLLQLLESQAQGASQTQ